MTVHPKIKLSRLRDIGWSLWDPIGLGSPGDGWPESCADEYDSYLLMVSTMLCSGHSREDASEYLRQIAGVQMGLSDVDAGAAKAAANAIADYLETLPDGPSNVP
ncbi:MAG TPA: hypothetical protein VGN68_17990 [Sphingopyxis sp.]|jgi:hypothetical protein|uniref:hypothetical protein n=1 Tax=Sphingopyxis sp. TaxID=1908224 RepID=UPI002E13BF3D|nr:hypothetical protein [Sphingopyxis sp.]